MIQSAAQRFGIDPRLLAAVGMQESGLGRSSAYDPQTGLSRTKGNAGHGLFQLDPASGASPALLARAAKDPQFAALVAAAMLARNLKGEGGNVYKALEDYNGGGLGYADSVLRFMGNR